MAMAFRCGAALLVLGIALVGCAQVARVPEVVMRGGTGGPTETELHAALGVWAASFESFVGATADQIRAESADRTVKRHAVLWQLRMIPLARLAAFQSDPQAGYVSSFALARAQSEYLRGGQGSSLFGDQQARAREAARRLEQEATDLGQLFLNDRQLSRLRKQVDELIAQHPIQGVFAADALIASFVDPKRRQDFTWVTDLPMAPFRALSGVSDTAQAVQNFNETAREFTAVVGQLPQLSRWQLELLLYDAEELESIERALRAAEAVATGAQGLSEAAGTLSEDLGTQLTAQLHEARATLAELDTALARAQSLGAPLTHVADRVGEASAQWTALLTAMRADRDGNQDGRPFDVREYESAAAQIADASRGLRELVADVHALDASGAARIVDRATWSAAVLIAVFFASLAGYRLLVARLRR
jgi:hypothetical protein